MSLWRALITGPEDTPYSGGCFIFDLYFPPSYPGTAPQVGGLGFRHGTSGGWFGVQARHLRWVVWGSGTAPQVSGLGFRHGTSGGWLGVQARHLRWVIGGSGTASQVGCWGFRHGTSGGWFGV